MYVYISFLIAHTFKTLFINLDYTGVCGHVVFFFFKENTISVCFQMGMLAIR